MPPEKETLSVTKGSPECQSLNSGTAAGHGGTEGATGEAQPLAVGGPTLPISMHLLTEEEREQAQAAFAFLGRLVSKTQDIDPTLEELWAEYDRLVIPSLKSGRCERSRARTVLGTVLPDGRRIGSLKVSELTRKHALEYRAIRATQPTRRSGKSQPASRNQEIGRIVAMLTWACENKLTTIPHPWRKLKKEDEPEGRTTVVEPPDFYDRYLPACDPRFVDAARLAYESGMRRHEAFGLRKDNLDARTRSVILYSKDTKTKQQRRVPLLPALWEMVVDRAARARGDYLFPSERTGRPWSNAWIHRRHVEAVRASGITAHDGVWFHDFRASWVTIAGEHMRRAVVKKISGHRTDKIFQKYDRVRESDFDVARDRMERALRVPRKPPRRSAANADRKNRQGATKKR